jgi:hypothetical protein
MLLEYDAAIDVRNVCEIFFAHLARKRRELEQPRVTCAAGKSYLNGGYTTATACFFLDAVRSSDPETR